MLSLYRTSALVAPLKAGARPIATSAVLMAKKKEIDPSLPSVPKAPASAYTLFVKKWFTDNRQSVTADGAKVSIKSIAGQMGQAWNDLTEASKEEYTKQAKDLKSTYDKEYRSFLEGLSDDSIKAIEAATGKKLRIPGGKKARSRELSKASGSPGKPLTAFFEFMRDFRERDGGDEQGREKATAVAKRAGEKWNSMSEGEKQEWKDKAASNKSKFDEWYKSQHQ